jgi:transcriptional regulator with XRE-family HTH domain
MAKRDPNFVDAHVGNRVRLRRQLIGMSQEKLGELLGITFQQVQKYEKGSNRVSASRLHKMSKVLNVPIQYFFEGLQEPENGSGLGETGAENVIDVASSVEGVQLARILAEMSSAGRRKLLVSIAKAVADAKEL